mmetsp:Transcript_7314/g.7481  ORF Transcript_7314/g.7481 Transcript_7314/m.7481 type:complete len:86 (+) Transcript_7314:736-993(+)
METNDGGSLRLSHVPNILLGCMKLTEERIFPEEGPARKNDGEDGVNNPVPIHNNQPHEGKVYGNVGITVWGWRIVIAGMCTGSFG